MRCCAPCGLLSDAQGGRSNESRDDPALRTSMMHWYEVCKREMALWTGVDFPNA